MDVSKHAHIYSSVTIQFFSLKIQSGGDIGYVNRLVAEKIMSNPH